MDINIIDLKENLQSIPEINVFLFDELPSTNDEIKKNEFSDFSLIAAKSQTNGRGRRGKSFSSSLGGLYFSLKIPLPCYDLCAVTSLCAVAVLNAIEDITEHTAFIKWVNDIYMDNRKIAGILTEAVSYGGNINSLIIGIGINTDKVTFGDNIKNTASSIEEITGKAPDKNMLTAKIVRNILTLIYENNPENIFAVCRDKSIILGRNITVILKNETIKGIAKDISDSGKLIVDTGEKIISLDYGEVSIKL